MRNVLLDELVHCRRVRDCLGNINEVFRRDEPPFRNRRNVWVRDHRFYFLSVAVERIPVGTAYAVWTGIGAIGTALIGMMLFRESAHWLRLVSIAAVLLGIAGLRLSWRQ